MAVRLPRLLILPTLILSVGLLLFGCAEKGQTVSEIAERSDFSGAGAGTSESVPGNTGESGDIVPVTPGGEDAAKAEIAGSGGVKDDRKEKPENTANEPAVSGPKAGKPKADAGVKASDGGGAKSGTDEVSAANTGNSGDEVLQNGGSNVPAQKESIAPDAGDDTPTEIKFSEMYSGGSSRGLKFSDKLTGLNGKKVTITGYMAPPLKPSFSFFVLTKQPMAICPFCNSDASWPEDIVLIYLPKGEDRTPTDLILTVTGTLELGSQTDPDTGFVSQARIYSDKIKIVR